jgi:hypothetical protein
MGAVNEAIHRSGGSDHLLERNQRPVPGFLAASAVGLSRGGDGGASLL